MNTDTTSKSEAPTSLPLYYIALALAVKIFGVNRDTLETAHAKGRLFMLRLNTGVGEVLVDLVNMIEYMVSTKRYKTKWINIDRISVRNHQPRAKLIKNGDFENLIAYVKGGGGTDPVWLIRDGDELILIDGHHRLESYRLAGRTRINYIEVKVPYHYADVIAYVKNDRNGTKLDTEDKESWIRRHLRDFPGDMEALQRGEMSQAKLATKLGVGEATVSRSISKLFPTTDLVDSLQLRTDLVAIATHIPDFEPQNTSVAIAILYRGFEYLHSKMTPEEKRNVPKAIIEIGNSDVGKLITTELRKLYTQRGGVTKKGGKLAAA